MTETPGRDDSRPHFILVGHCGPDAGLLRSAVSHAVPGARFTSVNHHRDLAAHHHADAVWLVNRSLDGDFEVGDGVELIERVGSEADGPRTLLISNFADAQTAAMKAGALQGFGKSALYHEDTKTTLRASVRRDGDSASGA